MTKPLRAALGLIGTTLPDFKKILEIGSRYERNEKEWADVKKVFHKKDNYVGVDIFPGNGVDLVANAENLPFKNHIFDLILCFETLEHTKKPWVIAKEIKRVLKKSGILIVSTPFNHPLHFHPSDYYRYTPYGLAELFNFIPNKLIFSISPPYLNEAKIHPQTVVFIGFSKNNKKLKRKIKNVLLNNKKMISIHKPYRHRVMDMLKYFRRGVNELTFKQDVVFFE